MKSIIVSHCRASGEVFTTQNRIQHPENDRKYRERKREREIELKFYD